MFSRPTYAASTKQGWCSRCVAQISKWIAQCFALVLLYWCMFSAAIYESHGCLAQCFAPFWGMCNTAFNAEMFDSASNLAARCFDLCFALWVSMFNTAFIGIYHDVLHAIYFLFTMVVFFSLWCGLVLLTTGVGLGFCHRWRRTKWKARAVWINRRRYCVRRRRYSLSTTGSQNQYPQREKEAALAFFASSSCSLFSSRSSLCNRRFRAGCTMTKLAGRNSTPSTASRRWSK